MNRHAFKTNFTEEESQGSEWRILALVILAALLVRLAASYFLVGIYAERWAHDHEDHWTYAYETGRVARSLATGNGFSDPMKVPSGPTAWLPPIYPLVLAAVFKVFGVYSTKSAIAIRALNSIASALTCLPIFFIARRLDTRVGMWAAGVWALFPYGVYAACVVWDSSVSALIISCLIWMTLRLEESCSTEAWVGYGALMGIGELTNATMGAAFPFLLLWLWYRRKFSLGTWVLKPALTVLACLIVTAPWFVRNYEVFHKPFLIKSNFWLEFELGNGTNQWSYVVSDLHPDDNPEALKKFVALGEMAYMETKKQQGMEFLRNHAGLYLWLCVRRVIYVWTGFWSLSPQFLNSGTDGGIRHIFLTILNSIPLAFGLHRIFMMNKNIALLFAMIFVAIPFATYLTHPYGFYRFIIDPEVVLLGTYGVIAPLLSAWATGKLPALMARFVSTLTISQ